MTEATEKKAAGRGAVIAALLANLGVAVSKLVATVITGSSSLLAETLHSFADTGNQLLLLLGEHKAQEGPSQKHPFGRGRERYFWAFIVGLVLFGVGGVVSIVEGIRRFTEADHSVERPMVAIVLILVAVVLESASLRSGLKAHRAAHGDEPLWPSLMATRDPEVTVVVVEDMGALAGLVIALAGILAAMWTGDSRFDAGASVLIGLLLCVLAVILAVKMHALLIGEPAVEADLDALATVIIDVPEVSRLLNLRTEHLGPEELLVCAKVELDVVDVDRMIEVIDDVEARIHRAVPTTFICYLEPDRFDPARRHEPWT